MTKMDTAEVLRLVDGVVADLEERRALAEREKNTAFDRQGGDAANATAGQAVLYQMGREAGFEVSGERVVELRRVLVLMAEGK